MAGAGWATTIVSWFMFVALALHVFRKSMFRGYGIFSGRLRLVWPLCREILTLGTPVAGLAFLEAFLDWNMSGSISFIFLRANNI